MMLWPAKRVNLLTARRIVTIRPIHNHSLAKKILDVHLKFPKKCITAWFFSVFTDNYNRLQIFQAKLIAMSVAVYEGVYLRKSESFDAIFTLF